MLENLMIASIFITTMMTLIVLGLLVLAAFYFGMDYIFNKRRRKTHARKFHDRTGVLDVKDNT